MIKLKLLFFALVIACTQLTAQVKTKDFSLKPIGTSVLRDMHNVFDTIKITTEAPKPFSSDDYASKKAILNEARKAHFNKINRRNNRDTTLPLADNLPYVEGGFVDSLFTNGIPNDNHMCVGNNGDVVSVMNSIIRVYKGDGNISYNVGLSYFGRVEPKNDWPNGKKALTGSYDPKAMYDPVSDRFIIAWLDGRVSFDTRIVVAVSQTNDAAGAYSIYHLEGNPLDDKSWTDYPILSQSKNDIFITVNLLKDSASWQTAFKQSIIWQMDKNSFYNKKELKSKLWYDIKHENKSIWSICPVDQYHKSGSESMYFLSVRPSSLNNDSLFLHEIKGSQASGNPTYSYQVLKTSQPYGLGGSAYQPQAKFRLQTNDSRILAATYYYGKIQYAQNSINFSTTAPSIMHGYMYQENNTWNVKNKLITSDSMDFGYPSICYLGNFSKDNTCMLSFSHSSKTVYPGVSLVKIQPKLNSNNSVEISPIIRVREGNAVINSFVADSMERWGDYTGIQAKHNEKGVFYLTNSVGIKDKRNAGTYVGRMKFIPEENIFGSEAESIFPNPNGSGIYYALLDNKEAKEYQIRVVQLSNGKVLYENKMMISEIGATTIELNLSFLPAGTFAVQIFDDVKVEPLLNQKVQRY